MDKIVVVTRKTRLAELVERFNTRAQARFYLEHGLEHGGGDFAEYQREDDAYRGALDHLLTTLDLGVPVQRVERALVPTFLFAPGDVVVTLGQDGLVANTAKYVGGRPLVAVNPDPARCDGVLLPFAPPQARGAVEAVAAGRARLREVTLAEVALADGQRLLAFNDLFAGARSHVSARYQLEWNGAREAQSSSGVLISTGAGSTGWLSSVFAMAEGVVALLGGAPPPRPPPLAWDDPRLRFVVREPFLSRHSTAAVRAGVIEPGAALTLESLMPTGGAIFSDGVEADYLPFDAGARATIRAAPERVRLVVP